MSSDDNLNWIVLHVDYTRVWLGYAIIGPVGRIPRWFHGTSLAGFSQYARQRVRDILQPTVIQLNQA